MWTVDWPHRSAVDCRPAASAGRGVGGIHRGYRSIRVFFQGLTISQKDAALVEFVAVLVGLVITNIRRTAVL